MANPSFAAPRIERIGQGPEILVFHGGPGFDYRYLVPHLAFLAATRTLCFFDEQPGTAKQATTFAELCARAAETLRTRAMAGRIEVIAHSFGALVLVGALQLIEGLEISGLLISPVPANAGMFEAMRNNLFSRMPADVISAIATAPQTKWPAADVQRMLPYYIAAGTAPDLSALSFDFGIYNEVFASLGDFDFADDVRRCARCHIVRGDADFITQEMIADWTANCASDTVIPGTGHFPFAEKPELFRSLTAKLV
jgi:pimeloyl-ACP methyl ester carboxylesterase